MSSTRVLAVPKSRANIGPFRTFSPRKTSAEGEREYDEQMARIERERAEKANLGAKSESVGVKTEQDKGEGEQVDGESKRGKEGTGAKEKEDIKDNENSEEKLGDKEQEEDQENRKEKEGAQAPASEHPTPSQTKQQDGGSAAGGAGDDGSQAEGVGVVDVAMDG